MVFLDLIKERVKSQTRAVFLSCSFHCDEHERLIVLVFELLYSVVMDDNDGLLAHFQLRVDPHANVYSAFTRAVALPCSLTSTSTSE